MKKRLSLLLAAALLLTCLGTIQAASAADKSLDVMVWYRDTDDIDFQNLSFYIGENGIEAETGVHAEFTRVTGSDWTTKVNLMLASGEYPDIIMHGGLDLEMYGVDQGVVIPLNDIIDQYMPNYQAMLDADPDLAKSLSSSDGKTYQIGWIIPQNINVDSHLFVNKAWLDQLGLEIPDTVPEYEAMLRAFKDAGDLNGNGVADELPYSGPFNSTVDGWHHMFSFWGVAYNPNYIAIDNDNKVYTPLLAAGMRDALTTLHTWYADGLMDVESVSEDTNTFEAKVNAATLGSYWRWRNIAMGTPDEVVAQYTAIVPPAAEGHSALLPKYLEIPRFGAAITTACEDVEAAAKWLDAQMTFEKMLDGYFGYKDDASQVSYWMYNEDGKAQSVNNGGQTNMLVPGQSGMHYIPGSIYFDKVVLSPQRIEKSDYCAQYTAAGVVEENSYRVLTSLCTRTAEESEQRDLLFAEIDKYAQEAVIGFVTNGVTDESWNTYVSTLERLKINDYVALNQTIYDRHLAAQK